MSLIDSNLRHGARPRKRSSPAAGSPWVSWRVSFHSAWSDRQRFRGRGEPVTGGQSRWPEPGGRSPPREGTGQSWHCVCRDPLARAGALLATKLHVPALRHKRISRPALVKPSPPERLTSSRCSTRLRGGARRPSSPSGSPRSRTVTGSPGSPWTRPTMTSPASGTT